MDAIRIQNLRCLADTGYVDLKPITVLLGENDSGKSTFLRSLPLLRQSVESRTTGPLLWYGDYVDYGSFAEAVNRWSSDRQMSFSFRFALGNTEELTFHNIPLASLGRYPGRMSPRILDRLDVEFSVVIAAGAKGGDAWTKRCVLDFCGHRILIEFELSGGITAFLVNDLVLTEDVRSLYLAQQRGLVPSIRMKKMGRFHPFLLELTTAIREHMHQGTQYETATDVAIRLGIGTSAQMLANVKSVGQDLLVWQRRIRDWTEDSVAFQRVRDLTLALNTVELLGMCDARISSFARGCRYVSPLRATAERYYRQQNLAVDEVDFQGRNLPMFLRSLSDSAQREFRQWTQRHLGFRATVEPQGGHLSLGIAQGEADNALNLADRGFGYSQLLPIVTQLWTLQNRKTLSTSSRYRELFDPLITLVIEQPELHLHPRMQARLADCLVETAMGGKGPRLLIETHSETIINRFGHSITKDKLDPSAVNVVIFEKPSRDRPSQLRIGGYDADGFLTNWPLGFFLPDED